MNGTITALVVSKGFGFIKDSDGHDRFFHAKDLVDHNFDQLQLKQAVTFDPVTVSEKKENNNGLRAENVNVVAN